MLNFFAILLGKTLYILTRLLKTGGGSAAPGLYALKVSPNLVQDFSSKIPKNIVITGTNGKTTTSKLLTHFLKNAGFKFINNSTGSNLERGIASTLVMHIDLLGNFDNLDAGVWELDEAAFNQVAPRLNPEVIVFLNVFRDQLDRYGEIDTVKNNWEKTLYKINPKSIIVLNSDDANVSSLKQNFRGKSVYFGLPENTISGEFSTKSKTTNLPDIKAVNIQSEGLDGTNFLLKLKDQEMNVFLPIPGIYHIYDFLAAFSAGLHLGLPPHEMVESLKNFSPAFGRVEKIALKNKKEGYILLIKNPVGATQVFSTISPIFQKEDTLMIALNDNLADGTDVSWIWDVNFESLQNSSQAKPQLCKLIEAKSRDFKIFVSGTRSYDLALRLKYAGFPIDKTNIEPNLEKAFNKAQENLKGRLFILPTYTAMLQLQKILANKGIKKNYWEEN